MNTPNTQQLQSQTLNTLNDFLSIWNQDLLVLTNSLVLTRNQITVLNETDVLLSVTLLIESEPLTQDLEKEQESLENLFPDIDLDGLIHATELERELILLLQEEIGNYNDEAIEEFSS